MISSDSSEDVTGILFLSPLLPTGSDDAVDGIRRVPARLHHGVLEYFLQGSQCVWISHLQDGEDRFQRAGDVAAGRVCPARTSS